MARELPFITVYVPCRNYGRFLSRAVRSVLQQTIDQWELLIVDDASTDETSAVISHLPQDHRITTYRNDRPCGLRSIANFCAERAAGAYLMRLDADDWLHPRALELLATEATRIPEAAVVFSDFFYADEAGTVIGVETLPRGRDGYGPTSFPPHGACSLLAVPLLHQFGGFDESLRRQDGHEVWLRTLAAGRRFAHVDIPLFYYRQHTDSLSSDEDLTLADRAAVKRNVASHMPRSGSVTGIINACNTHPRLRDLPFARFGSNTLLERVADVALACQTVDSWVVSTDCERVLRFAKHQVPRVVPLLRSPELRHHDADMRAILDEVAQRLGLCAHEALVTIGPHTPYIEAHHVDDAVRTYHLYDVDSVVSVYEERSLVYQLGVDGLRPLNPSMQYQLRREREVIYVDSTAIRVLRVGNLRTGGFLGRRIGHVLMSKQKSLAIRSTPELGSARLRLAEAVNA